MKPETKTSTGTAVDAPVTTCRNRDFDWDSRRRSSNNVPQSRLSRWLQKRAMAFARAVPVASDTQKPRASAAEATNIAVSQRPHTAHGCCTVATGAAPSDALSVTSCYDCKCVSCPELTDAPSAAIANAPAVVRQRQDAASDRPPRHQAVRKTCSETGFKSVNCDSVGKQPILSVPAVFVTSYTRSLESRSLADKHLSNRQQHHRNQPQQQPGDRCWSTAFARQRLLSMSDSRLGSGDHFTSTYRSSARIWKLTEFLCIGNAAAAINDRLLCRHSVLGLVDLCVAAERVRGGGGGGDADRWAPCMCGDLRRHRRSVLRLNVSRTDLDDIRSCFPTINRFVDGIRQSRMGCVIVYCETGDTLSVLAAAQYLVAVDGRTVSQVEECLAAAGCATPLIEAFVSVLQSIYSERCHASPPHQEHSGGSILT